MDKSEHVSSTAAALAVLGAALLYPVLESRLWSRSLWGAHALAFLPWAWWLVPAAAALLFVPRVALVLGEKLEHWQPAPRVSTALPWLAGALAAVLFWLVRERHLYWGDALPLSINVPAGQAFHPDEPLTLGLHHALFAMGGGRWSAVSAIAAASAFAGGLWVAVNARGFLRSSVAPGVALAATATLASQGAAAIFHGHVENYAYVAVCFAWFLWAGCDYLEGRGPAWPAFAALLLGYAFHLLGALALPAAALLVIQGLNRAERRVEMLATVAATVAAGALAAWAARGIYAEGSPLAQLASGVTRVLRQPRDMQAAVFFTWRHAGDLWSHVVQMGPLSLVVTALLVSALPSRAWLGTPAGRFLGVAAVTLYAPALLVGEGNLGAARNWDLFAAPALALPLLSTRLILGLEPAAARRRLLVAALAVSLAHSIPWTALNASRDATEARVAALPLGRGRSAAMLGTAALNAGDLPRAERWFAASLAEDSLNINAWSGLGLARARTGRLAEAELALTRATELKPGDAQYHRDLASLYMRTRRWEAASEQWQLALPLAPREAGAWLGLAEALSRAGRRDSSVYALLTARATLPQDATIERALADACALWVASAGERGDRAEFARAWGVFESHFPDDDRVRAWRPRARAMLER